MRRVREILRYRFEQGLGHKSIAVRVGTAPSTVRETLRRAARFGVIAENACRPLKELVFPLLDLIGVHVELLG